MNAIARIQKTILAELRMVWSTRQDSFERLGETGGDNLEKVGADEG